MPRRLPAEVASDAIRQATAGATEMESMQAKIDDRMIGLASSLQGRGSQNYTSGDIWQIAEAYQLRLRTISGAQPIANPLLAQ